MNSFFHPREVSSPDVAAKFIQPDAFLQRDFMREFWVVNRVENLLIRCHLLHRSCLILIGIFGNFLQQRAHSLATVLVEKPDNFTRRLDSNWWIFLCLDTFNNLQIHALFISLFAFLQHFRSVLERNRRGSLCFSWCADENGEWKRNLNGKRLFLKWRCIHES